MKIEELTISPAGTNGRIWFVCDCCGVDLEYGDGNKFLYHPLIKTEYKDVMFGLWFKHVEYEIKCVGKGLTFKNPFSNMPVVICS